MKNKALNKEKFKPGSIQIQDNGFQYFIGKGPQLFSNSDKLRKIKNRNRKQKRK